MCIVTNGGGAGVIATDAVESLGLKMANLSEGTVKRLEEKLPPHASCLNPIDVIGDAPVERYEVAIRAAMEDPNVDCLLVIFLFQSPALDAAKAVEMVASINEAYDKPLVVCAPGGPHAKKHARLMEERGVPVFDSPEEAVLALEGLVLFGKAKFKASNSRS